jgi:DNA-binding cell septation regulator SpoVG
VANADVRIRSWVRATDAEVRSGLLGYLSVYYGSLILDGIVLRRTEDGRFALSFPARTDRAGRRHPYFRPIDDDARREIEREILGQLGQHAEPSVRKEADHA